MDKLTTEQKAERYVQALDRAKKWRSAPNIDKMPTYGNRIIEEIFPELIEPEDEEVRKEIMQLIQCMHDADPRKERWLAWLEKQNPIMAKSPQLGKQKPAWSEKDEEMFMSLYSPNFTKEQRDWLKSLKDRIGCELNCTTMWKPSDEQMEALEQFISEYKDIDDNFRAYPISHNIESLYNDLKKLTE